MTTELIDLPVITATQRREIEIIEPVSSGVIIPTRFGVEPFLDRSVLGLHLGLRKDPERLV